MSAAWKSEVTELDPQCSGYWVTIWTGSSWEFFRGPLADRRDADAVVEEWCCRYGLASNQMFTIEYL